MEIQDTQANANEAPKVVLLHGFTKEQVFAVMRAVKQTLGKESDVAFAMTTPHSLQRTVQDIVTDVAQEHAWFKEHPPKNP